MEYYHSLGSLKSSDLAFKLSKPIDFVLVMLKILELMITWGKSELEEDVTKPYLYVESKDLKRAFIVKDNQIVSFAFPFAVYTKTGDNHININNRSTKIDATLLSEATSIANDYKKSESFVNVALSLDMTDEIVCNAASLVELILSMEPSYIRYDYDKKSSKGQMHPTYHFDVNYAKVNSYKLGLYAPVSKKKIISIISKETKCFYLEQYIAKWYTIIKSKVRRYVHRHRKKRF